jgi:NADH:ubiquinone oxidoreductase subunit F (NADH-binding)
MSAAAADASRSEHLAPGRRPRLFAGLHSEDRAVSLDAHLRRLGAVIASRDLISIVEESGLRGRGGGGFPTARKLAAVASAGVRAIVVANGAEGEPASGKDKALLRYNPQLVLDGVVLAAAAVGADRAIVAVSEKAVVERSRVEAALAERRRARLDRIPIRLETVPEAFVTGEETALLRAVAGRPAKPTTKPPYPFERGLQNRPTLVQNVETLAHLALIARFGASWYRQAGDHDSPGTALITLSGSVARPGVHEIELGTLLGDVLDQCGGTSAPVSAFLVGGYFGGWVDAAEAGTLRLTPETIGAGALVAFPEAACAVAESERVLRYLASQSAGQCGPCVHGLAAIADGFGGLARGGGDVGVPELERFGRLVTGRGACSHPDGAARFLESTLRVHARELELHARHGRCSKQHQPVLPIPAEHG